MFGIDQQDKVVGQSIFYWDIAERKGTMPTDKQREVAESAALKERGKRLKRLRAQLVEELNTADDPKKSLRIKTKIGRIDAVDWEKLLAILKMIAEIMGFIVLFLGKKPVE